MDLFAVIRSCIRRWYVVLPLLAATLLYAYQTYVSVTPVYYTSAVVGMSIPKTSVPWAAGGEAGGTVPVNGLLQAGGAPLVAQMLVFALNDEQVAHRVKEGGGAGGYTVRLFPTGGDIQGASLPLVMIESTRPSAESAAKTVELLTKEAEPALRAMQQQSGVPDPLMVHALVASPPTPPQPGTPSRIRSSVSVFLAGLAMSLLAGVAVDLNIRRRKRGSSSTIPLAHDLSQTADSTQTADALGELAAPRS